MQRTFYLIEEVCTRDQPYEQSYPCMHNTYQSCLLVKLPYVVPDPCRTAHNCTAQYSAHTTPYCARTAFDKGDLLYLRDQEERQRHLELEQKESETMAFARLRARAEAAATAVAPTLTAPKPPTAKKP